MERSSAILHISSLPDGQGIGDLGPAAYEWVGSANQAAAMVANAAAGADRLCRFALSRRFLAFAGNPNFISLERLVEEELLTAEHLEKHWQDASATHEVDYDRVTPLKHEVTAVACRRFKAGATPKLAAGFYVVSS